jgi:Pentapeptide repeats (9 copies)/Pentapeptide repeats (8 copies)
MTQKELDHIIKQHFLWLQDKRKGKQADLSWCKLGRLCIPKDTDLRYALMIGTDLSGLHLEGVALSRADLAQAVFRKAKLTDMNLYESRLTSATFDQAQLRNITFREGRMENASFFKASMCNVQFLHADLRLTVFNAARVESSKLSSCDCTGCNFTGAKLVDDTIIKSTTLQQVQGLRYAQVSFTGFGANNRMLTAYETASGIRYSCGCFEGTEKELRAFIKYDNLGLTASRMKALRIVTRLINDV